MPATDVKLPELGENLDGGEVLVVKVAVGDTVAEGQTLMEIEAEKATVEVPSPLAGRLKKLLVKKGDYVKVDQSICVIEGNGEAIKSEQTPAEHEAKSSGKKAVPPVSEDQPPPSPVPRETKPAADRLRPSPKPARDEETDGRSAGVVPAGPATRRLARELGIELRHVRGTAPRGRVTQDDVKAFVRQLASSADSAGGMAAPALPDFEKWGPVERRPLDSVRRRTAEQMSLAWRLIPHVTHNDLADVTELEGFRKQQAGDGPKITVTAFVIKAAAIALKEFEQFNASLDSAGLLVLKRYYHIGVAVDTDRGLLVPVIRDAHRKSVQELAQELSELAERARSRKITADEMRGGTFTITNLGGIGGTGFSPIVNYPEVAILGLSRARLQPVFRDDVVVARLLLPLSLSYDHRVIDGAAAARFTRRIAEMLENPLVMLLHA
jgi:pyruvate dehydrogenase E2 component (dihydrolipoamide acetyltransferase)